MWKIIKEHPDYKIVNSGIIKNRKTGEVKSVYIQSKGYPMVSLDGKSYLLHRLVASCFVPNPYNKPCVDHIDGNKLNCNARNLRWVTYHENNSNPNTSWKNQRSPWNVGLKNPYSEETLKKMLEGAIKGGEAFKRKCMDKNSGIRYHP